MRRGEAGLSVASLLLSLLIVGVLAAGAVTAADLGGSGAGTGLNVPASADGSGSAGAGGNLVGAAGDVTAEQNLSTALDAIEQQVAVSGYAGIDPSTAAEAARGLHFTSGPSTAASDLSIATSAHPTDGSVMLAARSESGRCLYLWTASAGTWYGRSTSAGESGCQADSLSSAPSASISAGIEWSATAFP